MNLWIVFLFSITLSFASYSVFTEGNNGKLLRKELDSLTTILKRSFYWENKYDRDLKLYTASVEDYTGTCTQSIFECFYKEFEVLLEEISLVEEEHVVNKVAKNFNQALQNMRSYNRLESKMPLDPNWTRSVTQAPKESS
ncbi:interleukin-15 isoform 2-T2 [Anomaloglossus baeobatrachus]|uniref:interleukin-15 isoform X2 n=1 Tax=Anomaloglossus baeobatrachus TaxID=238106 RepID=UPI003F4FECFC